MDQFTHLTLVGKQPSRKARKRILLNGQDLTNVDQFKMRGEWAMLIPGKGSFPISHSEKQSGKRLFGRLP